MEERADEAAEGWSSAASSGIFRSLPRASSMPGGTRDGEGSVASTRLQNLERSKTERKRQKPHGDPTAQIFDDKTSTKKKVHHGGAGTTAAGLKAACPTTVVPFFGDQPFWGEWVHARGLGPPPIPVDQFSLPMLIDAINFMLKPEVRLLQLMPTWHLASKEEVKDQAIELRNAMASEDGVAGAVKAFFKHLPPRMANHPRMPRSQPTPEPSNLFGRWSGPVRKCFGCS